MCYGGVETVQPEYPNAVIILKNVYSIVSTFLVESEPLAVVCICCFCEAVSSECLVIDLLC